MKDCERIGLSVGFGENQFTMSRGSFRYKQQFVWKEECRRVAREDDGEKVRLIYEEPRCRTRHALVLEEYDGRLEMRYEALDDRSGPSHQINRYWLTIPTDESEHIYGCGETYSVLDLKGEKVRIWVAEHQNASRIARKLVKEKLRGKRPKKTLKFSKYESYYAQPTFVSSNHYYVHGFINQYAEFDFTKPDQITLYTQEPPHFVMEEAENFITLSEKLSALLGRQRTLPDWIYDGGILALQDWTFDGKNTKEAFDGCNHVEQQVAKARANGARINGVWCQDWCGCRCTGFGYQVMWNWKYDREQYPNLPKKIQEWQEQGIHFLGYINPFLALEKELYQEAKAKGYCVKNQAGEDYQVTITTFPAAMIDFTNPAAYEWYKDIIKKNMIGIGMSGWMADFGEYLPVDAVLYDGDAKVLHNQWPAMWARLNREAIEECGKQNEVFFFTRAGHTGSVADSAMMWTGDQHVDWSVDDGIGSVIPATLSLAMSGCAITHSDVGGYTTIMSMRRSKELLLRWEEMNAFSPLFRLHEGNQPANNVQFDADEQTLAQLERTTRWHANLKWYLFELVREATERGTPVMRPLFYHYDEPQAYIEKTEYLLGRDLLVAPVIDAGVDLRTVYLPEDTWVHLFTKEEYSGGIYSIEAPIGRPAVFVRKEKIGKFLHVI